MAFFIVFNVFIYMVVLKIPIMFIFIYTFYNVLSFVNFINKYYF